MIPAIFGLIGTLIGGLVTFLTTYYLKKLEWRQDLTTNEIKKRENLYSEFVEECGRLLLMRIDSSVDRASEFGRLISLQSRIKMISSPEVVAASRDMINKTVKAYKPNVNKDATDVVELNFSEVCRAELDQIRKEG